MVSNLINRAATRKFLIGINIGTESFNELDREFMRLLVKSTERMRLDNKRTLMPQHI